LDKSVVIYHKLKGGFLAELVIWALLQTSDRTVQIMLNFISVSGSSSNG